MKGKFLKLSLIAVLAGLMTACSVQPAKEEVKAGTDSIETEKMVQKADGSNTISVMGQGEVNAVPTMARISVGVNGRGETAEAANAEATKVIKEIAAGLKALGLEDKDIQTAYFNVYEDYSGDGVARGYIASNMLDVTVRDLANLSAVMESFLTNGATMVNGVSFDIPKADRITLYNQAMQEAIAEGQSKAKAIADSMGVTLGAPKSIIESNSDMMFYSEAKAMATDALEGAIEPGQISVTANVNLVYNY